MTSLIPAFTSPRDRLAAVLRAAKEVVSIDVAAETLAVDRQTAAKALSRWREQGWLRRVGHGLYVSVPLELSGSEQVLADPWVLVPTLFGECYVGGWTAAHHWDLTEQLFNETVVFTTRRLTEKRVVAQGTTFLLHHVPPTRLFGLKPLWRGATRVHISDPARTLIDMLTMPGVGGGIDHVADCLSALGKVAPRDAANLIRYAEQYGSGAVFKRLGFLADRVLHDTELASACRERMTQGNAKLDPTMECPRLVTEWRVWVPERWKRQSA